MKSSHPRKLSLCHISVFFPNANISVWESEELIVTNLDLLYNTLDGLIEWLSVWLLDWLIDWLIANLLSNLTH